MAPTPSRISGPSAVRHLVVASVAYQECIRRIVADIQGVVDSGLAIERETAYAQLLLALAEAEHLLEAVAERCRHLLGET